MNNRGYTWILKVMVSPRNVMVGGDERISSRHQETGGINNTSAFTGPTVTYTRQ